MSTSEPFASKIYIRLCIHVAGRIRSSEFNHVYVIKTNQFNSEGTLHLLVFKRPKSDNRIDSQTIMDKAIVTLKDRQTTCLCKRQPGKKSYHRRNIINIKRVSHPPPPFFLHNLWLLCFSVFASLLLLRLYWNRNEKRNVFFWSFDLLGVNITMTLNRQKCNRLDNFTLFAPIVFEACNFINCHLAEHRPQYAMHCSCKLMVNFPPPHPHVWYLKQHHKHWCY